MVITIAGVSVAASRLPDLRIYLKKAALSWSAIVSVQDAFTVSELNALGIGNTVTLGADEITWTGTVTRLETRTGYSLAEITAPVADNPGINNYHATTDPTVTDDDSQGYRHGSLWFNVESHTLYMCESSAIGSALWRSFYPNSGIGTFINADGSVELTGNWNAGDFTITSNTFQSSVATGTAPLTVASQTLVDNLNADMLDGHDATYFAVAGSAGTGDVVGPGSSTSDAFAIFNSTSGKLIKDGVATLADVALVAGRSGGQTITGGTGKSENLILRSTSNATKGKIITASQFESTLANGTAPFVVDSSTVVANLNASQLEGHNAAYFAVAGSVGTGDVVGPTGAVADSIAVYNSTTGKLIKDGGATIAQIPLLAGRPGGQTIIGGKSAADNLTLVSTSDGTLGKITTASPIESTVSTGTVPIAVSSTTMCTNLNAAKVNGFADTAFVKVAGVSGGQTIVGGTGKSENLTLTSTTNSTKGKVTTASQFESTLASGTAPFAVASSTVVANLNAAQVNGFTDTAFAKLNGVSGGQTLTGGTGASENLTLASTSNGTKGKITTASQVESTLATGTAPLTVTSTTVCPNLNASQLEGHSANYFQVAGTYGDVVGPTGAVADNFAVYNSTTGKLIKDGGAKLTDVALVAGRSGGQTITGGTAASENLTLVSTSNATKGKITTASQIESTVATSTAPITVTSTTICPNLNASLLEGHPASYFAQSSGTGDVSGPAGATADSIAVYNSTTGKLIKDGGATIAQIPLLAGRSGGQTIIGGTAASDNLTLTSTSNATKGKVTTASQLESTLADGTAPITVTSTTVCPNLHAADSDKLEGHAASYFQVAGTYGDVVGPAGAVADNFAVYNSTTGKLVKDSGAKLTDVALVAGRSGGQTITGGTAASDNLTLVSTSNVTKGKITTASQLESTLANGTAPIAVTSTTVCPNLNASKLEGYGASHFQVAGSYGDVTGPSGATADSIAVYNNTTGKLIKDGGATIVQLPLLAGRAGGQTLIGGTAASENLTLTSTSNATKGKVTTASQFESTLADGTAPILVTSTTVCPNLNASKLEGHSASYFQVAGTSGDVVGPSGATADSIAVYNSTTGKLIKDGGATIAQLPLLAGRAGGQTIIGGTAASENLTLTSTSNATKGKVTTASEIESTLATGTAPITVTSTTVCPNLNASRLEGHAASYFQVAGTYGDVVGPAGATADSIAVYNSTTGKLIKDGGATIAQLPLLAGRAGGQTLIGGTAASENLILTSTSNATKGKVTTASRLESTLADGTAPITVTSTTVCPNLNASRLEGNAASAFAVSANGVTNGNSHDHIGGDGANLTAASLNFAATGMVAGRVAAGAGVGAECTVSQILDMASTGVGYGDLLIRNFNGWEYIHPGPDQYIITSQGENTMPTWEAREATIWTLIPAFPIVITSTTTFTISDLGNQHHYNQVFGRGTVIKWITGGVTQYAVVVDATYAADKVTITIRGNNIVAPVTDMKACSMKAYTETFIVPGTMPTAAISDIAKTVYTAGPSYIFSAIVRYKTPCATTAGAWTIKDDGVNIFTGNIPMGVGLYRGVDTVCTDMSGTALTITDKESVMTLDYVSGHATTPGADAYVSYFWMPISWTWNP